MPPLYAIEVSPDSKSEPLSQIIKQGILIQFRATEEIFIITHMLALSDGMKRLQIYNLNTGSIWASIYTSSEINANMILFSGTVTLKQ